jgi:hypothetical protein
MTDISFTNEVDALSARALRRKMDKPPAVDRVSAVQAATRTRGGYDWFPELVNAVRGPGLLTINEYFYYKLYDHHRPKDALRRYIGKRAQQRMHFTCNDQRWFAPADDKMLFYTIMRGAGLLIPDTVTTYDTRGRSGPKGVTVISDTDALRNFLLTPDSFPIFAKPIDGMYSIGSLCFESCGENELLQKNGTTTTVDDIVEFICKMGPQGYLFQRVVQPHSNLVSTFGDTLSTVRFLVLFGPGGPRVESAVVKIPRVGVVADNYWRIGNMLGGIDIENGRVVKVCAGTGQDLREVTVHPDTEKSLIGLKLPDWDQALDLCLSGASLFPPIRTQSWDIALSDAGPMAIEMNFGGDINLHQIGHGRGALSEDYAKHLRRCGYRGKLSTE